MKTATMLYQYPGPYDIHGDHFNYVIVDADEVDGYLDIGWYRTTPEAKEAGLTAIVEKASGKRLRSK